MKWVRRYWTVDAFGGRMCLYWIRKWDPALQAEYKVLGYGRRFRWRRWWAFQRKELAAWLLGDGEGGAPGRPSTSSGRARAR